MQSHFSILSVSIRPDIQEQVTIGLLLVGNDSVHFRFSKNKLAIVRELLSQQANKYLKDTLRQISIAALKENEKLKGLFSGQETISKSYSVGYLEYLSRYSNNLVTFSTPKIIELESSKSLYETLFKKYIDEFAFIEKVSELRNFDNYRNNFFTKVQPYFNVEKEISSREVPGLILPVKVDLIGRNEKEVYAQAVDLERQNYHIQNDIAVLLMLHNALGMAKGFHISSEPDNKLFPSQHETWKSLKNFKDSEYVDLSEVQKIEDYAIKHGVEPLVK